MSTVTKAIMSSRVNTELTGIRHWITQQNVILAILLLCVFASAFAVIYARDVDRQLVSDWQGLQMQKTDMVQNYNQLLLEDAAWSTQSRIMDKATQRLAMVMPDQQAMTTLVS